MLIRKVSALVLGFLIGLAIVLAIVVPRGQAEVNFSSETQTQNYQTFNFLSATTTTATSTNLTGGGGYFKIAGAKKVSFYFSRGGANGANTGSSKFEVEVSPDGTNWYDFNRLMLPNTTQTASSTLWITAATSTVIANMDLDYGTFYGTRCQVVEVTDGEHTCTAAAEF